jgi:tetratricopeptide (TPR) repeat protein
MRSRWIKWVAAFAVLAMSGGAAAFYVLITPSNPFTKLFRGTMTTAPSDARIVMGPYPLPDDFADLAAQGVETIVSLLDPRLPYERVLIERERTLAAEHGMDVLNYPMASVLGQSLGSDHEARVAQAAEAIATLPGKVFLHCYLGIHRAQSVVDAVAALGVDTERYLVREGERAPSALVLDQAQAHYEQGRNEAAATALAGLASPTPDALLLHGWVLYRMQDVAAARGRFAAALADDAENHGARIGLGYCALRESDLAAAASHFEAAIVARPQDVDALVGIGLVRYRQGRGEEAATHLRVVLGLAPEHAEARTILARLEG